MEGLDRAALVVGQADLVVDDPPRVVRLESVAEEGGMAELSHQRRGELVEGVGEDHHLEALAQPVEEVGGAVQGAHAGDHLLDVAQSEAVLGQDCEAALHQDVVVGLVAGGAAQRVDAGALGDVDPDLGDEDPLEVEAGDLHVDS